MTLLKLMVGIAFCDWKMDTTRMNGPLKNTLSHTTFKKLLALFLVAPFFLWHLLALIIVISPENPFTAKGLKYARAYTGPLFPQNWQFFAPEPPTASNYFLYRCRAKGRDWGPWFDPGRKLLLQHKANRLSYNGKLLILYYELIYKLETKIDDIQEELGTHKVGKDDPSRLSGPLSKSVEYKLAGRFASGLCKKRLEAGHGDLEQVQFRTVTLPVKEFGRKENEVTALTSRSRVFNYPTWDPNRI